MADLNASGTGPAPVRPGVDIGRLGVWTGRGQWPTEPGAAAEAGVELEGLGFGAAWIGGSSGQLPLPRPCWRRRRTLPWPPASSRWGPTRLPEWARANNVP